MDARDLIGTVIAGKYRVTSVLGKGAMGVVFRAAQLDAEGEEVREVALKMVLHALWVQDENIAKRFLREIRAAARVRGPNVVPVFDFGQTESGELFFVMDLVRGSTLREVLDRERRLPETRAVEIAKQICDALHEAHSLPKPVIHRDLKPGNIFIERWPESVWVRVGDFGIAKVLGDDTSGLTKTGPSPGTPRYMAPEQCRGVEVDARADLYALGVILFELLAGHTPFSGDPLSVMYQHEHQPAPALPEKVAPRLRDLVTRLLQKDRDLRPRSAAAVHAELEVAQRDAITVGGGPTISFDPPTRSPAEASMEQGPVEPARRWRKTNPRRVVGWLAASMVLLALGVGLAVWLGGINRGTGSAPSSSTAASTIGTPTMPGVASVATPVDKRTVPSVLSGIAVLEFRNERPDDRSNDWMCTALQTTFSTELSKVQNLRVYSREFMEAVPQGRGGTMDVVRGLGASKFLSGSFAVYGGMIRVDARLVDANTGVQETAESVEGKIDEFFDLQKKLALRMLDEIPVGVSPAEKASIAAANRSDNPAAALDAYRLLLQGEGIDAEDDKDAKPEVGKKQHPERVSSARGSRIVAHLVGTAYAEEAMDETHSPETSAAEAARKALERYRLALERGDLDGIVEARGTLSERERTGLRQYFQNAKDLRIEFANVELQQVEPSFFTLSYLRRDHFADRRTGENVNLEVRIESALVLKDDRWVVASKKALGQR